MNRILESIIQSRMEGTVIVPVLVGDHDEAFVLSQLLKTMGFTTYLDADFVHHPGIWYVCVS